jgi:hypothetical protein
MSALPKKHPGKERAQDRHIIATDSLKRLPLRRIDFGDCLL